MSPNYRAVRNEKWPNMWTIEKRGAFGSWKYMHTADSKAEAQAILDRLDAPEIVYPSPQRKGINL